jgi:hypothetical protein
VGTRVFTAHGWRANALLALGWMGAQVLLLAVRGPHLDRYTWLGYAGGIGLLPKAARTDAEKGATREEIPIEAKATAEATDASALVSARPPLTHRSSAVDRPLRPMMLLNHRSSTLAAAVMGVLPAESMTAARLIES